MTDPLLQSGRFKRISVNTPQFCQMLHESKSQSSPSSNELSLLEEEEDGEASLSQIEVNDEV